jgi:hypothetical protein
VRDDGADSALQADDQSASPRCVVVQAKSGIERLICQQCWRTALMVIWQAIVGHYQRLQQIVLAPHAYLVEREHH